MSHDPMQISRHDYHGINFQDVRRQITENCQCMHKDKEIIFYTADYRNNGICIEFSFEDCLGQGCVYIDHFKDYIVTEIDYIVKCDLTFSEEEINVV